MNTMSSNKAFSNPTPKQQQKFNALLRIKAIRFMYLITAIIAFASLFSRFLLPRHENDWCDLSTSSADNVNDSQNLEEIQSNHRLNPQYESNPCLHHRTPFLFYLTKHECELTRRFLLATAVGSIIGLERISSNDGIMGHERLSRVRTSALVSLTSAVFTVVGIEGFLCSTMYWDSSRVSAAIPSGVGFLATALIYKGEILGEVRGISSASSLWISAAAGLGAGGGLYFVTSYAVLCSLIVLRFGPQLYNEDDEDDDQYDTDDDDEKYTRIDGGSISTMGDVTAYDKEIAMSKKSVDRQKNKDRKKGVNKYEGKFFYD